MTPSVWFALVDRYVTPPVVAAGYVRIGAYDAVGSGSRSKALREERPHRLPALAERLLGHADGPTGPVERKLAVGYEALDDVHDEVWLYFYPASGGWTSAPGGWSRPTGPGARPDAGTGVSRATADPGPTPPARSTADGRGRSAAT